MEGESQGNKIEPIILSCIEEALKVIKGKIKSKKGFPFDLPNNLWLDKLYHSQKFIIKAIKQLTVNYEYQALTISLQNLLSYIDSIFTEDTLLLMRRIKTLASKFLRLREILAQDKVPAKQIKIQLQLFMKQLEKQSRKYPRFLIIIERLKTYWKYLFHGYDDIRIPLTNLEIERSFNSFKRSFRKRTGLKSRASFFVMEGEILMTLDYMIKDLSLTYNYYSFYQALHLHRLNLIPIEWHQLQKQRNNQQRQHKYRYHKKYSLIEANQTFNVLKGQI